MGSLTARPPSEDGSATVRAPDCPALRSPVFASLCRLQAISPRLDSAERGTRTRTKVAKALRGTVVAGAGERPQDKEATGQESRLAVRLSEPVGGGSSGQGPCTQHVFTEHLLRASASGGKILMPPALRLSVRNTTLSKNKIPVRRSLILTEGSGQELAFGPRPELGQE